MAGFEVSVIFNVEAETEQHACNIMREHLRHAPGGFAYEIDLVLELEDED